MANWIDAAVAAEQRKDMLRAAAQRELVARARTRGQPSRRLFSRALVRLGRHLELWGCRLQARYDVFAEAGVAPPSIRDQAAS
jgi:hypothetical protein